MTRLTTYEIRLADTGAPTSLRPFSARQVVMGCDFAAKADAVAWFDVIRAATCRQQVTLYGPKGRREREAWGLAAQPADFQKACNSYA